MEKEIAALSAKHSGEPAYSIRRSEQVFEIKAGEGFKAALTNKQKRISGISLGEIERNYLHGKLDEWIDDAVKKVQ